MCRKRMKGRRVSQSVSRNVICNVLPLPNRAQLSQARTLTKHGEINVHAHGLHAHDVGDLASVACLVILRSGYERVHVLADPEGSAMSRRDLLVVSVPNNLRLRISAAWSTGELHVLSALHGLTLGIALYVRWTRWICEADAGVVPLYKEATLMKLIWKP